MPMEQRQKKYWLALNTVNGLGIAGQKALIQAFGSPEQVFRSSIAALCSVSGIGKTLALRIRNFQDWNGIDKALDYYNRENVTILCWQESFYPALLSQIYDPPSLIFVRGTCKMTICALRLSGLGLPVLMGL